MTEKLSDEAIKEILTCTGLKNPFRAMAEVETDFKLRSNGSVREDPFVAFVREELLECCDSPKKAVADLLQDLNDLEEALLTMDPQKLTHPFFCPAQVQVIHAYLGGACKNALGEKTRQEALGYVNGPESDRLLRLILASTDERNGFTPKEVQDMFEEAYKRVVEVGECVWDRVLKAPS